ncbi:thrombospondin type 3 repeat-containing protein [Poritiphilus flavus]|uniref:T9SS type A sorting domain-containing protein n=1 Tax=Poritiphilus flavus TaxID=2697053 RepID=A0A6L9EIB3_9FLAO|nr:thrombospondin type 3 repeat-containing protein [Poritiphilus flavus]NAS14406.1 T9SS type A sorting domain-containing protein [Poritiphilus flavus]
MTKKIILLSLLVGQFSYAQFNSSAPWMKNLEKSKSAVAKSQQQRYTLDEISAAFHEYWKGKNPNEKGSGYKPYMRWENYWKHFVDENGYIPTSKELWDAWAKARSNVSKTNPTSNWTPLGPFESGTLSIGQPGNGRINAVAVDPSNANTWYAGAPAGGIWKSTDAGATWTILFDDFPQIGVSGIAIDPNDSDVIYIATGDDDAGDSYSIGVFKSINGGDTWNATSLNANITDFSWSMNEIFIDPTNSNIVWVATNRGLYKSINAGDTWELTFDSLVDDFRLKPGDPNTIYVVTESTFHWSTDGGDTFERVREPFPDGAGRMVIGVTEADPTVVYVLVADTQANDSAFLGLFRSDDSGQSFTQTLNTTDLFERNQAWYDLAIAVSPTNADEVYTGAINIWKSTNGGDSFVRLNDNDNDTGPAYTHVDIHTLKFFNNELYVGSDGGFYVSSDGGTSFTDYTDGMSVTQFYRISIAKNDASRISGGTQDNSGFVYNNQQWNIYTGADGMDYEIDPSNSNVVYGFIQFGGALFITSNFGQNIGAIGAPRDDDGNVISGEWITPLAVGSDGEVYAGFDRVYRLAGNAWEEVSSSFTTGEIDDLEVDPNDPMTIYAAEGNNLYRSQNGGITFLFLTTFAADISDIAVNTTVPNTVYVTTSRRVGISQNFQFPDRGVFKVTIDGNTATEENITLNLPTELGFFSIAHQGRDDNNPIYVGTSVGVYRLDDTLTEWEEYLTNMPGTAVSDLEISLDDELIVAGTYGRGAWQSPIPIQPPNNDVRLVSFTPTSGTVLCGEVFPEIVVENQGLNPITQVSVTYTINGGTPQNFDWSDTTLMTDDQATIALPSQNFDPFSTVEIEVSVTITNDAFDDNNSATNTFFTSDFGVGDAINTFETADENLLTYNEGGGTSAWEKGVPQGTLLNQAGSGTQVYGTNLDGNYPDQTKSYLVSNCYELSSILAPVLRFNMAYDLEENWDVVYVEYSTDEGASWNVLGNVNSQPNWYTSDRTNATSGSEDDCQNCPGAQWTGTNATVTEYAYDFIGNAALGETDLTAEPNVLFRIVFHSDEFVNQEGIIIDDIVVEGFQDDDDDDNDGILDVDDNCPLIGNAAQLDTDGDGLGDACDTDDDNDGILDGEDNCPLTPNADQADADNDGIGDVCDNDADNDGVPNNIDQCDDTPVGSVVDIDGCAIFSLPNTNFRILSTGESCISSNDGSITIETEESLNYTATLSGNGADQNESFNDSVALSGLSSGDYTVCITVEGQSGYEICFDVNISEPEALSVTSKVSSVNDEVSLELDGGKTYIIQLNSEVYRTSESSITLPLTKASNQLIVRTDKDCQGTYEQTIVLSSELFVYPNPVAAGTVSAFLGETGPATVDVALYNINGQRIFARPYETQGGEVVLSVDNLPGGIYLLNVRTKTALFNFKIVRR